MAPYGPAGRSRAFDVLRSLIVQIEVLELDADLANRASGLAVETGLRAYDAVHLASYERIETDDSVLVAADGELTRAAEKSGHAVARIG